MPDLIIKPTNTSGNKVIIQDQAGGAVLTTADSGATFSGGNIGTVTAGNLSHADIVYPSGHMIQHVYTVYNALASGATTINWDSSDMIQTEGVEFMTQAITPTNANNILFINAQGHFGGAAAANGSMLGLFQDSAAGALAWLPFTHINTNYHFPRAISYYMVAGTTSSTTFKCRYGVASGNAFFGNNNGSVDGKNFANISISEIVA